MSPDPAPVARVRVKRMVAGSALVVVAAGAGRSFGSPAAPATTIGDAVLRPAVEQATDDARPGSPGGDVGVRTSIEVVVRDASDPTPTDRRPADAEAS